MSGPACSLRNMTLSTQRATARPCLCRDVNHRETNIPISVLVWAFCIAAFVSTQGCKTVDGTKGDLWTQIVNHGEPKWEPTGKPNLDSLGQELVAGYAKELQVEVANLKGTTENQRVFARFMNTLEFEEEKSKKGKGRDLSDAEKKEIRDRVWTTADVTQKKQIAEYLAATSGSRDIIERLLIRILPVLPDLHKRINGAAEELKSGINGAAEELKSDVSSLKPDVSSLQALQAAGAAIRRRSPLAPIAALKAQVDFINKCNTLMQKLKAVAADWKAS